jgi:hypothetical protein
MSENNTRIKRPINKKNLLIFFVLFVAAYCLLNYIFKKILRWSFSDLVNQFNSNGYTKISMPRYHELIWWQFYKPFILLITLSLSCFYTAIFKRNYFKETLIAFLIFIVSLFAFAVLSKLYTDKQQKDRQVKYQNLIVGKWHYNNRRIGNVVVVFSKDSTGYRFTNAVKTVQKFRYSIYKGSFLSFYFESNESEFYDIDKLTISTLDISAGPFTKIKGNVYDARFERGSP